MRDNKDCRVQGIVFRYRFGIDSNPLCTLGFNNGCNFLQHIVTHTVDSTAFILWINIKHNANNYVYIKITLISIYIEAFILQNIHCFSMFSSVGKLGNIDRKMFPQQCFLVCPGLYPSCIKCARINTHRLFSIQSHYSTHFHWSKYD